MIDANITIITMSQPAMRLNFNKIYNKKVLSLTATNKQDSFLWKW